MAELGPLEQGGPSPLGEDMPCPVPREQRPLREYDQLCRSWFFAWPLHEGFPLVQALTISWLIAFPPSLLVASGSLILRQNSAKMVLAAAVAALALPLLLLCRQWLGWTYVRKRLVSERVEYEESGWYDGQVWEKPLTWRQRDLLVASHQVAPVLHRLRKSMAIGITLTVAGTCLCQALW